MSSRVRQNLLNQRAWYTRQVNRPWKDGDLVKISIRGDTLDRDLTPEQYYGLPGSANGVFAQGLTARAMAASKIFDFYGVHVSAQDAESHVKDEAYHFFSRPMTQPLLLFSVPKESIDLATPKQDNTSAMAAATTSVYRTSKLDKQIGAVAAMFKGFQNQSKFFNGSTKPSINFIQDYNKLATAVKKIKLFIDFNNFEYRPNEDDKIRIDFGNDYSITNIVLVQRGLEKPLVKGNIYFLEDVPALQDPRINRLLANLNKISRLKTTKKIPTWSQFLTEFLPFVEINFFGRPHSETEANKMKEGQIPFVDPETEEENEKKLKDPVVQLAMLRQAMEKDPNRKKMEKKLEEVAAKMQQAEEKVEIVREFISKWGIDNLIFAALECLAIKSGYAMSSLPPIPGLNPYDLMPKPIILKIPKIDFQLPTIDIAKALTDGIKKGLIDAAYDALMQVTETLADIIVELCRGQPEDEDIGDAIPINSLIDLYPQPTEMDKEGFPGVALCLEACYEEYGVVPETGDTFLSEVAKNITPRETCDLINGAGSDAVGGVVKNILNTVPAFSEGGASSLRNALSTRERITSFFVCIGGCVSSDYCEQVYAQPPINVDNIDPCTIEDLLAAAIDPSIFDALLDAYDNGGSLMEGTLPDLGCGAGVVPAFANMPALNHSITSMFSGLFDIPKTTFINDISLLKDILLVPTPGCSAENAALMSSLNEAGALPNPGPPRDDEGVTSSVDKGAEFLQNLFPSQLMSNPQVASISSLLAEVSSPSGSACAGVAITYDVAPEYKNRLAQLDQYMSSPWLQNNSALSIETAPDYNNMYFSTLLLDYKNPSASTVVYYSPGELVNSANPDQVSTSIETIPLAGSQGSGTNYQCAGGGPRFGDACNTRANLAEIFESTVFDGYISAFDLQSLGGGNPFQLRKACKKSLYFSGYLSLFNSLAYNIRNSRLFKVSELRNLSLIPIPCPNGAVFGTDLFDINSIIQEALNEFEENSCSDKTCVIGPVEDALIFAAMNAYIQVLLLEQLLKNVFLIDTYGLGSFLTEGTSGHPAPLVNIIIEEIYESIGASSVIPTPSGAYHIEGATWVDRRQNEVEVTTLRALISAAIIYVDKLRIRTDASGTRLPNPVNGTIEDIPSQVITSIETADLSVDDTYGKYALEYIIRKRLDKTADAVNQAFDQPIGDNDTSFLKYGLPVSDVLDPPATINPAAPLKPKLAKSSTYEDMFTWQLEEPAEDSDAAPIKIPYEYGTSIRYPGLMSDSVSLDEALLAKKHGVFVRENYIKVAYNNDNLKSMLAGTIPADVDSTTEAGGAIAAQMQATQYANYAAQIQEWMQNLLPIPATTSNTSEGTYSYDPGWNDMVVGIDRFNSFVNDVRRTDTKPAASLEGVEVNYIVRTKQWSKAYNLGKTGKSEGDLIGINLGLGCPDEKCYDSDGRTTGPAGNGPMYHVVRGPLKKENYDAVRFWINYVQGASKASPSSAIVASEGEFYPESSYRMRELETRSVWDRGVDRHWKRDWDETPAELEYPWVANEDLTTPTEGLVEGEDTRVDYISEQIALVDDNYDDLHNRISVKWGGRGDSWQNQGVIGYRLRKKDIFPGDYRQAVWTGWPINTLRGWTKHYWTPIVFPGNDLGPFAGDWPRVDNGESPHRPGFGAWAINFFHYPSDTEDEGAWAQHDEYATVDPVLREPVAGQFLPDSVIRDKLKLGYATNTIPTPARWGWNKVYWNSTDPAPRPDLESHKRHNVGYSGDVWLSPSRQLSTQDPNLGAESARAASAPSFAGLKNGEFEVVGIYLSNSAIQNQILNLSWSDFRIAMGAPPQSDPFPDPFGGPGSMVIQQMSSEMMRTQMMEIAALLDQDEEGDDADWPRSEGYLTGDKSYDNAISTVLKNIRVGTRIVYSSPVMNDDHPVMKSLRRAAGSQDVEVSFQTPNSPLETPANHTPPTPALGPFSVAPITDVGSARKEEYYYYQNKTNYLIESTAGRIWCADTGIFAEEPLAPRIGGLEVTSHTVDLQRLGGGKENKYVDTRMYDVVRPFITDDGGIGKFLERRIADDERYIKLFKKAYDTDKLLQLLFMIGLRSSDMLSGDFTTMFSDTKQSIRMILRAALAGDDYAYKDPESSSSSDAAANAALDLLAAGLMPFTDMGQSFILKMLIETPIRILKGLAEMIDPHVVVGKAVKDISGQVIEQAEKYWNLSTSIAGTTAGLAGEDLPDDAAEILGGTLVEFMQNRITQDLSAIPTPVRPSVSDKGLNLIGTLPFMFAIPPTPLGIMYILLQLSEGYPPESLNPAVLEALQNCADLTPEIEPQLGALPPPEPGISSTYDCNDEEDLSPDNDETPPAPVGDGTDCT